MSSLAIPAETLLATALLLSELTDSVIHSVHPLLHDVTVHVYPTLQSGMQLLHVAMYASLTLWNCNSGTYQYYIGTY